MDRKYFDNKIFKKGKILKDMGCNIKKEQWPDLTQKVYIQLSLELTSSEIDTKTQTQADMFHSVAMGTKKDNGKRLILIFFIGNIQ